LSHTRGSVSPRVFVDQGVLAKVLREACHADLPAEQTGPRWLRRRRSILTAVVTSNPPGVVACCHPCLRIARSADVDDVAGVTVLSLSVCIKDPLFGRIRPWLAGCPTAPSAWTDASWPCVPLSSRVLPCWCLRPVARPLAR
jgi:hypothetical protein